MVIGGEEILEVAHLIFNMYDVVWSWPHIMGTTL